jgi:hypothetical protein
MKRRHGTTSRALVGTSTTDHARDGVAVGDSLTLAIFHVAARVSGNVPGKKSSEIGPLIVTLTVWDAL